MNDDPPLMLVSPERQDPDRLEAVELPGGGVVMVEGGEVAKSIRAHLAGMSPGHREALAVVVHNSLSRHQHRLERFSIGSMREFLRGSEPPPPIELCTALETIDRLPSLRKKPRQPRTRTQRNRAKRDRRSRRG